MHRARLWHATTAAVAVVSVAIQFALALPPNDSVDSTWTPADVAFRIAQFFSYFTIHSNILVAAATMALVVNPAQNSRLWRVVRVAGLYGITVTFVVYGAVLGQGLSVSGAMGITNTCLHYVVPALTVGGWLLFGPRPRIDLRTLALSAIWPVAYMALTLAHGYLSGWYPYPFINVNRLGYPVVIGRGIGFVALMLAVGAGFWLADRRLPATRAIRR